MINLERFISNACCNSCQSFYDHYVEANVRFRSALGMKAVIIRRQLGHCCDWCASLAGIYDPSNAPDNIYRRHSNCRCLVTFKSQNGYQDVWNKKIYQTQKEVRIQRIADLYNTQNIYTKRKIGIRGKEVCDKPTYNRLTKDFLRRGGEIIRGELAERILGKEGAGYFWGGNCALLRDDATVSEVLEEMYHAFQERKGMFNDYPEIERRPRREIDAQYYLLNMVNRYKISVEEIEEIRRNLDYWKAELEKVIK